MIYFSHVFNVRFDSRKVRILQCTGYFLSNDGKRTPANDGLFATRDLLYNEKIVLFIGSTLTISKYNKAVNKGDVQKGYAHYINDTIVYSCYAQYRNGSCVASAANSSLRYFGQDSNFSLYYIFYIIS